MRWGETIGLERDYLHQGEIHVEWQLRELNGRFHRLPPKDDSYRSPKWEPKLPVDLPRFLEDLITLQVQDHTGRRCACAAPGSRRRGSAPQPERPATGSTTSSLSRSARCWPPQLKKHTAPLSPAPAQHTAPDHRARAARPCSATARPRHWRLQRNCLILG